MGTDKGAFKNQCNLWLLSIAVFHFFSAVTKGIAADPKQLGGFTFIAFGDFEGYIEIMLLYGCQKGGEIHA